MARVWDERDLRAQGLDPVLERVTLTLRGGHVLRGLAPVDVVDTVSRSFLAYMRRIRAFCSKEAFARRATPSPELSEGYQAFAGEAAAGSYRLHFTIAQPQLPLDLQAPAARAATPADITTACVRIAALVEADDFAALELLVDDPQYRGAILRILRAMMPDGSSSRELELRRAADEQSASVRLYPEHRAQVTAAIRRTSAATQPDAEAREGATLEGVLRAADLDKGRLRLKSGDDRHEYDLEVSPELDDTIGPMLNKRVVVVARLPGPRTRLWVADDIELATPQWTGTTSDT